MTIEEINMLAEELAERELAVRSWLDSQLRPMSDDDLKCIAEHTSNDFLVTEADGTTHDGAIRGRLRRSARSEMGYRRALARAQELNCEVYCVIHDRDLKDCPADAHDD